jgi:phenylacetate-coenzyme A ligase PaaK-like adenylate-forming protein
MLLAFSSRSELEAEQLRRLRWSIAHTCNNAPYYRAKCEAAGVSPDDVRSLGDLARFPFTLKSDFRDNYPFDMFAVPREKAVRIHASSGTTGQPTIVGRRMDRIAGRSDDMLMIRGVNIFPRQIEELIVSEPGLSTHYRIDIKRDGAMDALIVTCEAEADDTALYGRARAGLSSRMKSKYGLSAEIVIAETGSLPRSGGKAKRVFDHRNVKP